MGVCSVVDPNRQKAPSSAGGGTGRNGFAGDQSALLTLILKGVIAHLALGTRAIGPEKKKTGKKKTKQTEWLEAAGGAGGRGREGGGGGFLVAAPG